MSVRELAGRTQVRFGHCVRMNETGAVGREGLQTAPLPGCIYTCGFLCRLAPSS